MEEEEIRIGESGVMMGEKPSLWSQIPGELGSLIQSHLPHKDHATLRATCKSWSFFNAFNGQHRSPSLLVFRENQYYLFDLINNTYQLPIHQPPPTVKILHSNSGWLLMGKLSDSAVLSVFFFNIFTNERVDLPDFPLKRISKFSFSSSPTSSDCYVVGVKIGFTYVRIIWTKAGEKDWTILDELDFTGINKPFHMSECNPIFHNGQCFCLDINGRVGMFDPKDPEGTWRICGKPFSRKPKAGRQVFMVESDGELLSATVREEGRICIYKLHSSQTDWIELTNLDNKVLYLSHAGSWIEKTNFKGMGNKIYFPMFQGNLILFYSIGTKKYHSYRDQFSTRSMYNLYESMSSTWIKPMF